MNTETRSFHPLAHVGPILVLAVAYFLAGKLSLDLALVHPQASAVWPPTGIALAALLLRGCRLWPGVLLGAFLVNVTTGDLSPAQTLAAGGIAIGNSLEALLGAYSVRRFVSVSGPFDRARRVFAFVVAVMASTAVSAICGTASLSLAGLAEWDVLIWRHWWIGDTTGALVFTPLLVLIARDHSRQWSRSRLFEAGAMLLVTFASALAAFTRVLPPQPHMGLAFLCIPPLLWAAFRFGQREVAITMLPISVIGIWGILSQRTNIGDLPTEHVLLEFQIYMGVMSTMFLAVAADITERKQADQALRDSQEQYELVVAGTEAAIWDWDVRNKRVIYSPRWKELRGLSDDEVSDREDEWSSRIHPDDSERVMDAVRHHFEGRTAVFAEEYRVRRKDGSWIWILDRGLAQRDAAGRAVRMAGSETDITGRKQAEEALRESEERFRTLADSSPVLIWIDGLEGCEFVNRAYLDYLRVPPAEVKGSKWEQFLHPDDRDGYVNAYESAFAKRETCIRQFRFRRFDGEYRWMKAVGVPRFSGSGDFQGYVGCTSDITDIKEAEERLREDDRRKDEFIAILAHELRNPLAALSMGLEVMKRMGADPSRLSQIRGMMERQSRQLIAMVDDLLEVSRITRGKLELRKTRVSLVDIIESAIETARPAIDQARHHLSVEVPDEKLETEGDPHRLSQVFSNLLGNAAKFTPHGGNIWLTLERRGDEALLAVRDSGIGIPASMHDKIFDMFAQAASPLHRGAAGLGVGLTLSKTLVEMHGGTIELQSEGPGKGSEFRVRLPLAISGDEAPRNEIPQRAETAPASRRVLIVDDNEDAAEVMRLLVKDFGSDVRTAADGVQAIAIAADFKPEVVLMDLRMPRMNGYEAAQQMRRESWGKDILLVALTGWGQEKDRQRIMQAGFDRHLVKPAKPEQLRELLAGRAEGVSS